MRRRIARGRDVIGARRGIAAGLAALITLGSGLAGAPRAAADSGFSYSIWSSVSAPSVHPNSTSFNDPNSVEVGVKFRSDVDGTVTAVRFYKGRGNNGTHVGHLWTSAGASLASVTFANETATGWQEADFSPAVAISSGVTYVVSYFAPTGHYAADGGWFAGGGNSAPAMYDNPPLHALAAGVDGPNGLFSYSASPTFPSSSHQSTNYWVDVVFSASLAPPTVAAKLPVSGAVNVALSSSVDATFSQQIQDNTLAFSLVDGASNPVDASVTYDPATRVATLDPIAELAPATTYTASVSATDLAGARLVAPVTWSFTTTATPEPPSSVQGQWGPRFSWPQIAIASSMLSTGKVMTWDETYPDSYAHIYDPVSGAFTKTTVPGVGLWCGGQVHLADGSLMSIGGNAGFDIGIKTTMIFNPATGTWRRAADMHLARWYASGVRLADGRVFVLSGQLNATTWADTPEIYDPNTDTWTLLTGIDTSAIHENLYPYVYLMPDGRIFALAESTGETFSIDVNAQTITPGPASPLFNGVAVQYAPGKILEAGGTSIKDYFPATNAPSQKTTAVIDLNAPTPTWRGVAPMNFGRTYQTMLSLADGRVMALGGSNFFATSSRSGALRSEIWDPTTEQWSPVTGPLQDPRMNHSTAVLLPDGRVLTAGGGHDPGQLNYYGAEIYSPPYLEQGARPVVSSATSTAALGDTVTIQTPDAGSVAKVSLSALGAITHQFNDDSVYMELPFSADATSISATLPANANTLQPGDYYLTIVNADGIPSVSRIVRIADPTPITVSNLATSALSSTNATLTWDTSAYGSSQVQWGTTTAYGSTSAPTNGHSQILPGLVTKTTYHTRVMATSPGGVVSFSSDFAFTTTGCPCTIWNSSATPAVSSVSDPTPNELGVSFRSDTDGFVTGVRFYKGSSNTGTHSGHLWLATSPSAPLATATFTNETTTGWQQVNFSAPVAVTANTTYVASYFAPNGHYSANSHYFDTGGVDAPPLHALGTNGMFHQASVSTFPDMMFNHTNYWVTPVFSAALPMVTATVPATNATGVLGNATISTTFNEDVVPSTIIAHVVDSTNKTIDGTLAYDSGTRTATFTPTTSLSLSTTFTATISGVADSGGNEMVAPYVWSFTTAAPAPLTVVTRFPTPGDVGVDAGTEPTATFDRSIAPESMTFSLTDPANSPVTGMAMLDAGNTTVMFMPSAPLVGGTTYQATVFAVATDGGALSAPVSWTFTTAVGAPVTVTAQGPVPGATNAPLGTEPTATFNEAVQPASLGFTLKAPGDVPVAGATKLDDTHTIATFVPSSPLLYSTTYTATVTSATAVDGGTLSAPVSWTFTTVAPGPVTVTAQSPTPGSTSTPVTATPSLTFNKSVVLGSLAFTLHGPGNQPVAGTLSLGPATVLTFTPWSPLAPVVAYTATLSSATATDGGTLTSPVSWTFTTAALAPDAPTGAHAVLAGTSVNVTWTAPASNGSAITQYTVKSVPANKTVIVSGALPKATITGLSAGSYRFEVQATNIVGTSAWSAASNSITIVSLSGYWMLGAGGTVYGFGDAVHFGDASAAAVAFASRRDGAGYWVVNAAGRVSAFGASHTYGAAPALRAGERASTISATPSGHGYWVFTNKGRAFPYGDAHFYGDMRAVTLNGPVIASVATASGHGYYMVGSDGGIFGFGDAKFHGSTGGLRLNAPIVGIAPTLDGKGYWLVASDGGVFGFAAPFRGSMGGTHLNRPVNGLVAFGNGYLMVASDGGVFGFSNQRFLGSLGSQALPRPIVAIVAFATLG